MANVGTSVTDVGTSMVANVGTGVGVKVGCVDALVVAVLGGRTQQFTGE